MGFKISNFWIGFGFLILLIAQIRVDGQEPMPEVDKKPKINITELLNNKNTTKEGIPSCKKLMMVMAKKQLKVFARCAKDLQAEVPDKDEFQKKFQCVVKCLFHEIHLLEENYLFTNSSLENFLTKHIPEVYHDVGIELMSTCINEYAPKLDPKDEYCISYGHFMTCIQEVAANVHC